MQLLASKWFMDAIIGVFFWMQLCAVKISGCNNGRGNFSGCNYEYLIFGIQLRVSERFMDASIGVVIFWMQLCLSKRFADTIMGVKYLWMQLWVSNRLLNTIMGVFNFWNAAMSVEKISGRSNRCRIFSMHI